VTAAGPAAPGTTSPVIDRIEKFVRDIPGWTPVDQLMSLFLLAWSGRGVQGDIVEIGSWCGRSACVLGLAASMDGGTHVHCIDPFPARDDWYRNDDGSWSLKVQAGAESVVAYDQQTVWAEPFERDILPVYERFAGTLEAFRHSVASAGLEATVTPFRGSIGGFLAAPAGRSVRSRLAFIDGDHGYEAVCRDIREVERILVPGGWICFDDAFTTSAGVDRAITECIIESPAYEQAQQLTRKLFVARRRG
jgi:hypothetical protein